MSSSTQPALTYREQLALQIPTLQGYRMNPNTPLHRLAVKRIMDGRDLKIIVTAKDSQTGVGKTTAAGWLALTWNEMFTGEAWEADKHATLDPIRYFNLVAKVGNEFPAGTVIIVDDAEELDARRSMQKLNVEFSQRWMLMRLKQAITILTLPSPSALDSRLEELADVWINIERRGRGLVHDLRVNSYGSRNVMTKQTHRFEFPDISSHPELVRLREMKEEKMGRWDSDGDDEQAEQDLPIELQAEIAKTIKDSEDVAWRKVADCDHPMAARLTYTGDYLRKVWNDSASKQ